MEVIRTIKLKAYDFVLSLVGGTAVGAVFQEINIGLISSIVILAITAIKHVIEVKQKDELHQINIAKEQEELKKLQLENDLLKAQLSNEQLDSLNIQFDKEGNSIIEN